MMDRWAPQLVVDSRFTTDMNKPKVFLTMSLYAYLHVTAYLWSFLTIRFVNLALLQIDRFQLDLDGSGS